MRVEIEVSIVKYNLYIDEKNPIEPKSNAAPS